MKNIDEMETRIKEQAKKLKELKAARKAELKKSKKPLYATWFGRGVSHTISAVTFPFNAIHNAAQDRLVRAQDLLESSETGADNQVRKPNQVPREVVVEEMKELANAVATAVLEADDAKHRVRTSDTDNSGSTDSVLETPEAVETGNS